MCGRTSCALCRESYQKATGYFDEKTGKYSETPWRSEEECGGLEFRPTSNVAPSDVSPVLLSGHHFPRLDSDRVLQPMLWSMIPPWHKGEPRNHGLSTNNCRVEGILKSKLYGPCLRSGKRCVIVCEGFYEWQQKTKQPYFVYNSANKGVKIEDEMSWLEGDWSESGGWRGPQLLNMAGLFNTWLSPKDEVLHSYSVITMDSNETMSWLHHRMPAILNTREEVESWLDYERVDQKEALNLLGPSEALSWHPVSTLVNNSKNKTALCNKPVQLGKPTSSQRLMDNWLKSGTPKMKRDPISVDSEEQPLKKIKSEH